MAKKNVIAENMVRRRKALKWSAERLSQEADLPYPTVRNIEAGVSFGRPKSLGAIAKALKCKVSDLFQEDEPKGLLFEDAVKAKGGLAEFVYEQLKKTEAELEAIKKHPVLVAYEALDEDEKKAFEVSLGIRPESDILDIDILSSQDDEHDSKRKIK